MTDSPPSGQHLNTRIAVLTAGRFCPYIQAMEEGWTGLAALARRRVRTAAFRIVLLCVVVLPNSWPVSGTGLPQGLPKIPFEKYTLQNGLQVILQVDRSLPLVHVNLRYHVGSKNEVQHRTGFAHLFEHMMGEGSKNAPSNYGTWLAKVGGFGNAYTFQDYTEYFETVPSGALEYALWLESDRLATLPQALTQERFDNQRDVVRNERRQRIENQPYGEAGVLLDQNLFPAGHPYAHDVIGSHDDLKAATLDDVKDFFQKYYTPNNVSLVIAGNFDVTDAKRWIEKYFGPIPPGPSLSRPVRWISKLIGNKIVEVQDRVPQERTYLAWPGPAFFEPGDIELQISASILKTQLSGDLVYGDPPLASDVSCDQLSMEDGSVFLVQVTARSGVPLSKIEQKVEEKIARLVKEGPSEQELEQAKNKWEYGYAEQMETLQGRAELLNQYNTFLGTPDRFNQDVTRHREITAKEIQAAMAEWLSNTGHLAIHFHPQSSSPEMKADLDRSRIPPVQEDRPFETPGVTSARLANGLEVLVVERPGAPKISVRLMTRAGTLADPAGREGLSYMTVTTMPLGTKTRSGTQINNGMRDLGATGIEAGLDPDQSTIGFDVLKRSLEPAFAIFSDVVENPVFHDYSFESQKRQTLDSISQSATDANDVADHLAFVLGFGRAHPYARLAATKSGINALSPEDLVRFHQDHWKPGGSTLIFVGDVSLVEAVNLTTKALGSWAGTAPMPPPIPAPRPVGPGKIYAVDWPNATQTRIVQILPGVARNDADYYAINLASGVWGRIPDARLFTSLREREGYTYGFVSSLSPFSKHGIWITSGAVQTDKSKESVIQIIKELKSLNGDRPVSEAELAEANTVEIRGYAANFETSDSIADRITAFQSWGVPMSELQREPEELRHTTLQSVNAAIRKYARPENESILLIGDLSKILPGLRALKLAEIVVLDINGNPIAQN
ncbi:MAG TPA: pitrilysin family protein [Blastocatellia bacterium]|nr:pitrilysin family protein [Blastocatellia bacterium]